ncbi:MAG: WxcM-like domain-containing protein [Ginsengibacter sp.]
MSNLNKRIYSIKRNLIDDTRGWFLKIINGNEADNPFGCEVYVTSAKPHESKGGHYHLQAREWFTLIKGDALLTIIDTNTNERSEISLSGSNPETIFIPPGIAHNFFNVGNCDFILIVYTDVKYFLSDTIAFNF